MGSNKEGSKRQDSKRERGQYEREGSNRVRAVREGLQ